MECKDCGKEMLYLGDCWECPNCGSYEYDEEDEY